MLCLVGLAMVLLLPRFRQWRFARAQDRLYIRNNFPEPIVRMRVSFLGYDSKAYGRHPHVLTFRDIPSGGEQWQLFVPKWGNGDSGRYIEIDAVTATGKRFRKESESANVGDPLVDLGLGARFYVTIPQSGPIQVQPN